MTRNVDGERLFHINRQLVYSVHPLLAVGQKITVGADESPFFRFFRTYTRRFSVTLADQSVVEVPALKFLRLVRDGTINAGNLKNDAYEIAKHFMLLARELLWESVRLAEFPDVPSRQRAIWLVSDLSAVVQWNGRLTSTPAVPTQYVEFNATGRAHDCDASLLLGDSESLDESYRKAREYWSGKMVPQGSEPEILFDGELEVVRIIDPAGLPQSS